MATLSSLAKEYAEYLRLNNNNPGAASEIVNRIKAITYTSSGQPLTQPDREKLVNEIESVLFKEKKSPNGLSIVLESEDSSHLIRLIQMIRNGTGESKK